MSVSGADSVRLAALNTFFYQDFLAQPVIGCKPVGLALSLKTSFEDRL